MADGRIQTRRDAEAFLVELPDAAAILEAKLYVLEEGGAVDLYPVRIDPAGQGVYVDRIPELAKAIQVWALYQDQSVIWTPRIEVVDPLIGDDGEALDPDAGQEERRKAYVEKIRFEVLAELSKAVGAGGEAKPCSGCGRLIFWFPTTRGKKQPFDPLDGVVHWSNCPEAGRFRTGRKR